MASVMDKITENQKQLASHIHNIMAKMETSGLPSVQDSTPNEARQGSIYPNQRPTVTQTCTGDSIKLISAELLNWNLFSKDSL